MATTGELLERVSALLGKRDLSQAQFAAWFGGAANGGPNGDGMFPLSDSTGYTRFVPSPAKQMELVGSGQGFSLDAVLELPAATSADVLPTTTSSTASGVQVIGLSKDGQLKRFTTDLFASRRTADLKDLNDARVNDMIEVVRGGVEGRINLGAIATIVNSLTINLASPPYNVVPDFQEIRDGITVAGSDIVDSASGMFTPADVGKMFLVSNGSNQGGGPMATTVKQYISPTRIRMADAATQSFTWNRIGWGTDNTAGVRLAAEHSETPVGADYSFGKTVVVPAGGILTRPFRIRARTTWFGYGDRQSYFVKAPALPGGTGLDGKNVSFIRNLVVGNNTTANGRFYRYADDFINVLNVGVHGGRYFQPGGDFVTAFELGSTNGSQPLAQVDPFWRIAFLSVWDGTGNGFHTFGRSSSNMGFLNVLNCNGMGCLFESYDDNVNTLVTQANSQTGLYLGPNGGANSNFTTVKSSYNGASATGNRLGVNVTIDGNGFSLTGFRVQESNNSNVLVRGSRNQISGGSIEDTGCMSEAHGVSRPPEPVRAGLLLWNGMTQAGGSARLFCYGNKINDVQIGPAVHSGDPVQYASHAVALLGADGFGGPQYNEVSFSPGTPFARINGDGSLTPWAYRDYGQGSGVVGKDALSSYNQNNIRIAGGSPVTD